MMKKLVALLLVVVMAMTLLPASALALNGTAEYKHCGKQPDIRQILGHLLVQ
jgi:hypothetical protein